jgi:hypothetical protein
MRGSAEILNDLCKASAEACVNGTEMGHAAPFIRATAWPRAPDLGLGGWGGREDRKLTLSRELSPFY